MTSVDNISTMIKERINASFEKLYHKNTDGEFKPFVCVVCDKFIKHTDVNRVTLQQLHRNRDILSVKDEMDLNTLIKESYTITNKKETKKNEWLKDLMLSPRAPYLQKEGKRPSGYACCKSCLYGLDRDQMPKYAIANGYFFGDPPTELTDLTMVERAMLSPVQTWGYCFTYTGGRKVGLQGSMTYYKVEQMPQKQMKGNLWYAKRRHDSISRAIAKMDIGFNSDIVIIFHGWMTPEQKQNARKKNTVRVEKMVKAIRWLQENNLEWSKRQIDYETIKQQLRTPTIIDQTEHIDTSTDTANQNIEKSETFHVYFPDGSMTNVTGGQKTMEEFQEAVQKKKMQGFKAEVQSDLQSKFVYDYKENNLVNACLLQFPFGRGGLHEHRMKGDESSTKSVDIDDYVQHLSYVSQKYFHEELFCLQLYNMAVKNKMLHTASWRVRGGVNSDMIANELTEDNVKSAINEKMRNQYISRANHTAGGTFVKAIDTVAQNVPHSNKAASTARREAEAIHFEHGQASWFLTVTPDDDNSFLMQVYSQTDIDLSNLDITSISNEQAMERCQERTTLRIAFPGISALFFEDALSIVIKDVIGWNMKEGQPYNTNGLFGPVQAFTAAVEEQGRGTLHVHLLVWCDDFQKQYEKLHDNRKGVTKKARTAIKRSIDAIATSQLLGPPRKIPKYMTTHECEKGIVNNRYLPSRCSDQTLRHMRHQKSYKESSKEFATCKFCKTTWTDLDIAKSYFTNVKRINNTENDNNMISTMKTRCIEFQSGKKEVDDEIVHMAYDKHIHTKSCFRSEKTAKRERKHKCVLTDYECRFRYPKRQKRETEIKTIREKIRWYNWDGSYLLRDIQEINIKRSPYDVFQNESCISIASSKLACNTNIAALLPGPAAQYTFKYNTKGTQEDDEQEYDRVLVATKKSLALETSEKTTYSIAISRLLAASLAHQKTNVIRGTLASYLTRHKSRFIMSHESTFCPVSDLKRVLKRERAFSTIQQTGQTPFFECSSLNYICRPAILEHLSPFEFYGQYESIRVTKTVEKEGTCLSYLNLHDRQHPSYHEKRKKFYKCIRQKKKPSLVQFSPYFFPDVAEIGGCLLEPDELEPNELTELYCEHVLTIFTSYRRLEDIQIEESFAKKLIEILKTTGLSNQTKKILQHVQDYRANALRYKTDEDDLQRHTNAYEPTLEERQKGPEENVKKEEMDMHQLQELLSHIEEPEDNEQPGTVDKADIPETLDLTEHLNRAKYQGGKRHVASMKTEFTNEEFILQDTPGLHQLDDNMEETQHEETRQKQKYRQKDFLEILLQRTTRRKRTRTSNLNEHNDQTKLDANGSMKSILEWGKCARFDGKQKRAFEILVATFVMSFYREAIEDKNELCTELIKEKNNLLKLLETKNMNRQLICFLHGPGGSGKSTVIDLLLEYAEEFCSFIPSFTFTTRTITTTAMSGVAATLIRGQTTHSALYLNKKSTITNEQIEAWEETRMLIIDEISFASGKQIKTINEQLGCLKQKRSKPYGGVDIIFCGDMRQLEPYPKTGKPIYDEPMIEFHGWINCYICLDGMHRYKNDISWGKLLKKFRDGTVTHEDIAKVNTRVVKKDTPIPDNIRYATYYNKERDAINTAIFEKHCRETRTGPDHITPNAVVIFSNQIKIKNQHNTYVDLTNRQHFWQTTGECDVEDTGRLGRMDPVLKIYTGCNVMFTWNKDVPNGIANGTQGKVKRIYIKADTPTRYVKLHDGTKIRAVYATEIKSIEIQHTNKDIQPNTFTAEPIDYYATVKLLKPHALRTKGHKREKVQIKCTQISLVINNATTGHKLQGVGVETLFVHEWKYYVNWPYVILSRVKTMDGIYLRKPIKNDPAEYKMPPKLTAMLQMLEQRQPTYWSERTYRLLSKQ